MRDVLTTLNFREANRNKNNSIMMNTMRRMNPLVDSYGES